MGALARARAHTHIGEHAHSHSEAESFPMSLRSRATPPLSLPPPAPRARNRESETTPIPRDMSLGESGSEPIIFLTVLKYTEMLYTPSAASTLAAAEPRLTLHFPFTATRVLNYTRACTSFG